MSEFISYLCSRYGVGRAYAGAYVEYWNTTGKTALRNESDLNALKDPELMWFDFALSANWRGRELAQAMRIGQAEAGGRYLDIGCGFGGMLVAFAEKGYEVQGIELDDVRVGLARSNLADIGGKGLVEGGNILDHTYVAAQRPFDVITCIDVIEHVLDVDSTISNAATMLRPGGVLYMEIPNKDAIDFVISDGHFSLLGITQLPRWAAIEYQQAHFSFDYDVGDYYPLHRYVQLLERHGLEVRCMPSPLQPEVTYDDVVAKASELQGKLAGALASMDGVPKAVRSSLRSSLSAYAAELDESLESSRQSDNARRDLIMRFGARFWLVQAVKSA